MENINEIEYTTNSELAEMTKWELVDFEGKVVDQHTNINMIIKARIGHDIGIIKHLPSPDKQIIRRGYNQIRYLNNLMARIDNIS